uniref:Regulatory protein zeste n=1 Tax=Lygus hesperus TaxID=30085 RepID=A0A0A9WIB5_LYGHE
MTPRKRQPKATPAQIDYMVEYFLTNPHVVTGNKNINSLNNADAKPKGNWEELAAELNAMYNGKRCKDVKSWKSTWRDNKSTVAIKLAKLRKLKEEIGNKKLPDLLTERDKKIADIVGLHYDYSDYSDGSSSTPDSLPVKREEENTKIVERCEKNPSAGSENPEPNLLGRSGAHDCRITFHNERGGVADGSEVEDGIETPMIEAQVPPSTSPTREEMEDPLVTQVSEPRNAFLDIAERQVSCMEMFAEAMTQQTRIWERMAQQQENTNLILQMLVEKLIKQS